LTRKKASEERGDCEHHEPKEAFMSHRNARLTPRGRQLLVERVRRDGMPVAHVAKAMGISRQCAHRWVKRFDDEGLRGLEDRSSRPLSSPRQTSPRREARVLQAREQLRCGPAILASRTGVPERTVSRILRRHGVPRLPECDPMTGEVIRASRATTRRYERERAGDLVHVDVKKLGKIPDGGGWRANGRSTRPGHMRHVGYDYVHSMVDDHSRFAYSEVLADEKGETCAAFLLRAAVAFAAAGIPELREVMTDNAKNYVLSRSFQGALSSINAHHVLIRPHCPWQNGKVERLNRTLQIEWAYRRIYRTNAARTRALAIWLRRYNNERPHAALGGRPPISRLSPT
jgi:transposase InsO family protein